MAEIEKVIKGLEECGSAGKCQDCVYGKELPTLSCKVLLNDALELLKEQKPVPPDMEGGGYNWYPVCGACHGVIGDMDSYCKHCGTPVLKKEIKIHHMRGGVEIEETE